MTYEPMNPATSGVKKILLVTDAWAPQTNGVVRVLNALVPRIQLRGHDVRVVEPRQFFTTPLPIYPEIRLAFFARHRIGQIVDEFHPDIVCVVTEGPLGWAARSVCKTKHVPFVSWYHSHFPLYVDARLHGLLRPIRAIVRRFHSAAKLTMVSTETLKKELEAEGYNNLVIMPLGVDTELFKRSSNSQLPKFPGPVFVYFSRLSVEKNPEEFFKLDLPGTRLVIGDGPLRKKLEKKYGRTHVFVGPKKGQELVDWLSLADVFVFPSRTETFGLVALEALACGIPVAAHDVMGPRDIVTVGKDGYLSDDLRWAALESLCLSPEMCRQKAEQYSWDYSADAFLKNLFPY